MNARLRLPVVVTAVALLALACASDEDNVLPAFSGDIAAGNPVSGRGRGRPSGDAPDPTPLDDAGQTELNAALETSPDGLRHHRHRSCLLPFPSDSYTVEDPHSADRPSGDLPTGPAPERGGSHARPDGMERASTGSARPPRSSSTSRARSGEDEAAADDRHRAVDHRGVRHRRRRPRHRTAGAPLGRDSTNVPPGRSDRVPDHPSGGFAARDAPLRCGTTRRPPRRRRSDTPPGRRSRCSGQHYHHSGPELEDRKADYDVVFGEMASAGVDRRTCTWPGGSPSPRPRRLAGNVLSMRDDAMGKLNGGAPAFAVTDVRTDDLEAGIAKIVRAPSRFPSTSTATGSPGASHDPSTRPASRSGPA